MSLWAVDVKFRCYFTTNKVLILEMFYGIVTRVRSHYVTRFTMKSSFLPEKYQKLWDLSLPYLKEGRPGDVEHAAEVAQFVLDYEGERVIDKDILVPVAFMHDIGHSAILPEHFSMITGPEKLVNGKLVHMLAGAKIAKRIFGQVQYQPEKLNEIIDIISMHDADQLKGVDMESVYDTENKKVFHDIDCLDRYTVERVNSFRRMFDDTDKILKLLEESIENIFYPDFKAIAQHRIDKLKSQLK